MENNNKKIVIKKILSKEFKINSAPSFDEESFDNKIDAKFYEPINEDNIDDVLKELKESPILYDTIRTKLSEEEIQRAGITLAKRIFELAQPRRETRDTLYLNAFNVVLESYRVSDQYRILQAAHQFFLNEYRDYMETRGERPGILSQIVRRVGKDNQEKYRHIVNGVNLDKIGKSIFDIVFDDNNLKQERIKNLLFGNSKNEISAIRSKVNILFIDIVCRKLADYVTSYKQLNKKNEDILFEIFADKEEYKKYFYTYTSPEELIFYLLNGREEKEIKLLEEKYNKIKQKDNAFKDDLQIIFKNSQDALEPLLNGISYEKIAKKVKDILYPENEMWLGEQIEYDGVYHKIKFPVKCNEINILKDIKSHRLRQIHQREKILQETLCLRGKKALKLNDALERAYKISLNKEIFPELFTFNPQEIAFKINNALYLRLEPSSILKIVRYLDKEELNEVKRAYLINFNSSLETDICDYSMKALKGKFNDQTKNAFTDILSGTVRLDSKFDLISYLLTDTLNFPNWNPEHQIAQNLTDAAYKIAEIINNETLSFDEIESNLTSFLESFSYDEIVDIKQVFYSLLEPKETFIKIIVDIFGKDNSLKLDYIINNNNNEEFNVEKILKEPSALYLQNNLSSIELESYKENFKNTSTSEQDSAKEDEISNALNEVNFYSAFLVRNFYTHILRHDNIDKFLLAAFDIDHKYLKAIELTFDTKYTSLRKLLKEMVVGGILSSDVFANIILMLENIPTNIINDIKTKIAEKKLRDLLKILSTYSSNQQTFEDIFEIILLDKDVPSPKLKQLIKDSESKLTDINECILFLDGYFPKELAKKIRRIVVRDASEGAGNLVLIKKDLTSLFLGISDASLIPSDINWKIEQNYIATLYYKALFKENIISTLRKLNLENKDIIDIANLIYGEEIVSKALVLEEIVSDQVIDEQELNTLKEIIPLRHKRFMMILREFFNSFTVYGKKLEDYIEENEEVRKIFAASE